MIPFLENVLRGRNVPRERMLEVAEHYQHFGGISPLNGQNRDLIAALKTELAGAEIDLPIYFGNRNWHPLLPDTLRDMAKAGVRRALAFFTSAYSSYSGCRQYRENVAAAQQEVGPEAPQIDKLRMFFNHPGFISATSDQVSKSLGQLLAGDQANLAEQSDLRVLYTAHSIPLSMARNSRYEPQLRETGRLVSERLGLASSQWQLVYQSRSGRPEDPWLDPDILDALRTTHAEGIRKVLVAPIGFLSDHMEVMYDLDHEARHLSEELGLKFERAATVGTHPTFVKMIRELIEERISGSGERCAIGELPASHDVCPIDCCPAPSRPGARPPSTANANPTS